MNKLIASIAIAMLFAVTGTVRAESYNVSDYDELAAAISGAAEGDSIILGDGVYDFTNVVVVSTTGLKLIGAGKGLTILDGGSGGTTNNPARVTSFFDINVPGVEISGITFRNATKLGYMRSIGGDEKIWENQPGLVDLGTSAMPGFKIRDCQFIDCHGGLSGSVFTPSVGITVGVNGIEDRANYPLVSNCDFIRCGTHPGLISIGDQDVAPQQGAALNGVFWVEDSTFEACTREGWSVVILGSSSVVTNCTFTDITGAFPYNDVGIVAMGQAGGNDGLQGIVRVEDCVFSGISDGSLVGTGRAVIDRCVVTNCYAGEAAKFAEYNKTADWLAESHISSALFRTVDSGECRNTLFIDNLFPVDLAAGRPLVNCTFIGNIGGTVCRYNVNAELVNCLFWDNIEWKNGGLNKGGYGLTHHGGGFVGTVSNCVFEHGTNSSFAAVLASDTTGATSNLCCRALDSTLMTDDFKPVAGSALNAGGTTQAWMTGAVDKAGNARLYKQHVDVGCYQSEFGPVVPLDDVSKAVIGWIDDGTAVVDGDLVEDGTKVVVPFDITGSVDVRKLIDDEWVSVAGDFNPASLVIDGDSANVTLSMNPGEVYAVFTAISGIAQNITLKVLSKSGCYYTILACETLDGEYKVVEGQKKLAVSDETTFTIVDEDAPSMRFFKALESNY